LHWLVGSGNNPRPFLLSEPRDACSTDQPGENVDQPNEGDGGNDDLGDSPEGVGEGEELDDIPDHPEDDEADEEGYEKLNHLNALSATR
jgi:hypothetical protein